MGSHIKVIITGVSAADKARMEREIRADKLQLSRVFPNPDEYRVAYGDAAVAAARADYARRHPDNPAF